MAPPPTPVHAGKDGLWKSVVLIGTRDSLRAMAPQFEGGVGPRSVGCVPTDGCEDGAIGGVRILGHWGEFDDLHRRHGFSLAIVSLPMTERSTRLRVRARLLEHSIPVRTVPTLADCLAGPAETGPGQRFGSGIDMVELIGRTPYGIDRRAVAGLIEGKRVLVTGAGGSIGSEICRIAATFHPSELILVERAENALFEIDRQVARRFPGLARRALLHDVTDADGTLRHLVGLRPQVVFHSAAHKHVPLMEDHPGHAITNNVFGTKSIADASMAAGVERFVMISSDKAVNPTSVMGATKRLAEMYVQWCNEQASRRASGRTSFTMVRFGNVLGSACSVLPIWTAQLAEGGPITVTDPRMTRYFMTIHEAATLVIQAGAIDAHAAGEGRTPTIFVLDMGEPVRIVDLAQRFISLQGFEPQLPGGAAPGADGLAIPIRFTGSRPGEKLHEELAYAAEALVRTPYPGILALAASAAGVGDIAPMISDLSISRLNPDKGVVVAAIRRYVPEMADSRHTETKPNKATVTPVAAA